MSNQKTIQQKKKPVPDFDEFLKVLRCEVPSRPVIFEFFMNGTIYQSLTAVFLRGLEKIMWDMMDSPEGLHKLMAFLRDGHLAMLIIFRKTGCLV